MNEKNEKNEMCKLMDEYAARKVRIELKKVSERYGIKMIELEEMSGLVSEELVELEIGELVEILGELEIDEELDVELFEEKELEVELEKELEVELEKELEKELEVELEKEVEVELEKELEVELEVEEANRGKKEGKVSKKGKERKLELEIELPYSGEIDESRCKGIRTAGKLYTQCLVYVEGTRYCKKCMKESMENSTGRPNNGDMLDRKEVGLYEYKDKDGKNPWHYGKLMRKHGWTREYVLEIGAKHGMNISEEHFKEIELKTKKGGKGRPKKGKKEIEIVEELEEREELEEIELKMREIGLGDEEEELEEEELEEEIVHEIEYKGEVYLRSKVGDLVYNNVDEQKVVGMWDRIGERIVFVGDDWNV